MFEGTELVLKVCVLKHGRENYTDGLQMYFAFYNMSTMNKYKTDRFRCIVQHNLMKSKTIVKMETDYLCFWSKVGVETTPCVSVCGTIIFTE